MVSSSQAIFLISSQPASYNHAIVERKIQRDSEQENSPGLAFGDLADRNMIEEARQALKQTWRLSDQRQEEAHHARNTF